MRLYIFDSTTQRVIGIHYFWDDAWDVATEWATFDDVTQVALKVADTVNEYDTSGDYLQPTSFASPETNSHTYMDPATLPPPPE